MELVYKPETVFEEVKGNPVYPSSSVPLPQEDSGEKETEEEKVADSLELYCDFCQQSSPVTSLRKCARCKTVYYCGSECQKKHWKKHKVSCQQYVHLLEEKTSREEYIQTAISSSCLYSPEVVLREDVHQRKIFDISRESPTTCQICYEVTSPNARFYSFQTCSHGFSMNCINSFFTLFEEDPEPPNEQLADAATTGNASRNISKQEHECPLCCTKENPFDPKHLQYCYSNILDFLFQAELFKDKSSLPAQHYSAVAKREYLRLLQLIQDFPPELTPLQYDILKLRMYDLLQNFDEFEEDKGRRLQEKKTFAKRLLSRNIKDLTLKLEIYQYYISALIELKEISEATTGCETILQELSDLSKPHLKIISTSKKCQEIIESIQYHWTDLIYQKAIAEEDCTSKEKGLENVIQLSREALQRNRHDTRYYLLLANVHEQLLNFKEAILVLELGLRYVLYWNKEEIEKLQIKLQALKA